MATCNCRVAASYHPASPMRRAGTGSTRRARRARRVSTPKTRSRNSGGRNSPRCLRPARTGIRSAGLRISSRLSPGLRQRAGVQYMPRTRDRACGRRAQRSLLITHPRVVYESDLTRLGPDWRSSGNSPPHPAWPTWTGGNLLRQPGRGVAQGRAGIGARCADSLGKGCWNRRDVPSRIGDYVPLSDRPETPSGKDWTSFKSER